MAVASYDVTRPAAAEGPANSSVPKQQRVARARAKHLSRATRVNTEPPGRHGTYAMW